MNKLLLFSLTFLLFFSCKETVKGVISENAMVVSAREEVSMIGKNILQKGGNAFDAMAGMELALAVAYPYAGSLGGGGFMVYRLDDGSIGGLDFREKAPLAASKNMYLDSITQEVIPNKSTLGAMAVGIPGNIAGIFASHEKYGKLPMSEIIEPVIALAKKGVVVTKKQQERLEEYRSEFLKVNDANFLFAKAWKANDTIKRLQLAKTLERIQKNGRDEFYKGETAQKLVAFMQQSGGIMTLEDLAKYEVKWRTPITFTYDDLRVISMSPPSSGGICLAEIMKAIEPYAVDEFGHNTVKSIQLITEAERRAYADRNYFLGDPDFVTIPTETLLSETYIRERMANFSFEKATPSSEVAHGNIEIVESNETTHYSIVDQFGNAVSVTTTINGAYGSKLYCEELGFFLNNEMDDFSAKPGEPNMFGLIGAEANSIAPEKRMLSSMTPTIVEKNGKLYMVVGTPGGSTIITSVLQTILNVHEHKMGMQEAINQPRFHHQWLPDTIKMEPDGFSPEIQAKLTKLGYTIDATNSPVIGKVEGILVLPNGKLEGGADPRGDDKAVGF
ncbi:gamma-glutamyltranspeptidase/glutathione hydrolase [Kordia periserrulae]|uniref:Glutathione hydrolase proenzyme n=1 Tax=Kordia periserrulae TaxID=701523 RepID=A0A2T6C007_9FLAO|nr:gamma-glutamyltransferase [Kordia periserrulae]PTX61653.1 gamma-glutamyltranspeptidase/glutathione hydrolase [Kordia periserrulae]